MVTNKTMNPYVVVIGAVNVDIGGISSDTLIMHDSNPGKMIMSFGGVGRNIAHNLTLMDVPVKMITVLGDDLYAQQLLSLSHTLGIDMSYSPMLKDEATSTYLYIANVEGEMTLAINAMKIYEHLTPEFLSKRLEVINNAALCVIDCNIPQESIEYLANTITTPILIDPVSTVKAEKINLCLDKITILKPNKLEAELLTGISIDSKEALERAAKILLDKGIKQLYISLGDKGIYGCTKEESYYQDVLSHEVINTTGCGDALSAALAFSYINGYSVTDSVRIGLAASYIASQSQSTINPTMNKNLIEDIIRKEIK